MPLLLHDFLVKFMCSLSPEFYMYSVPTKCQALASHSFVIAEETDLVGMEKPKYNGRPYHFLPPETKAIQNPGNEGQGPLKVEKK